MLSESGSKAALPRLSYALREVQEGGSKMRVLASDPVAKEGIEILKRHFDVDVITGLPEEELIKIIGNYDALIVRSQTKVTANILRAAKNLKIIGRAGVGVDNIDVPVATEQGIVVVNSPGGNTMAATEQTWTLLLAMSRNTVPAVNSLANGEWKRSKFVGTEMYNKTLGVIGLGKIGQEVAKRGVAFGMNVIGSDPYASEEQAAKMGIDLVSLEDIFRRSDYITVHIPKTPDTKGMINAKAFAQMKDGVRIVNCARGGIINEADLIAALDSGKVAAAALDVYEVEPPDMSSPVLHHEKITATPHLGASTREAQINVAVDVAEQICDVLLGGPARSPVNMPAVSAEALSAIKPYLTLAEKIGKLQSQLADGRIQSVEITYSGDVAELECSTLTRALMKGMLEAAIPESVNYVNAPVLAHARGLKVTESKSAAPDEYTNLISAKIKTDKGEQSMAGTLFGVRDVRICRINGYRVDVLPEGYMLYTNHTDKPGVIGDVGTLLGKESINIGGMYVGRTGIGKQAIMLLAVDNSIPDEIMDKIRKIPGITKAKMIEL